MTLSAFRTRLRRDLHDEDAQNYRWTDNELDRHIQHAVRELSYAVPREMKATQTTTAGSRELSIASLTDRLFLEAVEYPAGKYPPQYARFSLWQDTLTLLVDAAPAGAEGVNVYYGKLHTVDATTSSVPTYLEDLLMVGAAAYAALEWASFATNRINVGGEASWRAYQAWGQERLDAFLKGLANHNSRNRLLAMRLYQAAEPKPSQTTDWGP